MNKSYQTLFSTGRNYAAFSKGQLYHFRKKYSDCKTIFDPMSGYGTITSEVNSWSSSSHTVCMELNPPCYLWQYLMLPENRKHIISCLDCMELIDFNSMKVSTLSEVSNDWISLTGISLMDDILLKSFTITSRMDLEDHSRELCILSIIVPFVSRISTITNGDIKFVKKGGLAIFKNYNTDFKQYLHKVRSILNGCSNNGNYGNILLQGDARNSDFNGMEFDCMLTSPPYPISTIDYGKMFGPENYYINHLIEEKLISSKFVRADVIGTNAVSKRGYGVIRNSTVNDFLDKIWNFQLNKSAEYDAKVYYYPYYRNYFYNMQMAFDNIRDHLADKCRGSIIVRNNVWRKTSVPVSLFVEEYWRENGFAVQSDYKEVFHVGNKNPNVKGRSALHSEYTIDIVRSK